MSLNLSKEEILSFFKNEEIFQSDRVYAGEEIGPVQPYTWEEVTTELDKTLPIQDLISLTFLMICNVNVEPQFKLCRILEVNNKNEIDNSLIQRKAGAIYLHYQSSVVNNNNLFQAQLIEGLYHINNFLALKTYFNISKEDERFLGENSVLNRSIVNLYKICNESVSSEREDIISRLGLPQPSVNLETTFLQYIYMRNISIDEFYDKLWIPESLKSYITEQENSYNIFESYSEASDFYPKGEGFVQIFNNEHFTCDRSAGDCKALDDRPGTSVDRDNLARVFSEHLNATVSVVNDSNLREMQETMKYVSSEINAAANKYQWLAVFVLSHGMKDTCNKDLVYTSDGRPIDRKSIIREFLNTKLENLKHKPKFFFFIACRTDEKEEPQVQDEIQADGPTNVPEILEVDHLICSSTVDSYTSFRCTYHGSFYVQILCDQLWKHGHEDDILSIMTKVNDKMPYKGRYPSMSEMSNNTLKKKFFFDTNGRPEAANSSSGLCLLTHH